VCVIIIIINYSSHEDVVNHYQRQQRAVPTATLDYCNAITQPEPQTPDTVCLMKHSYTGAAPARPASDIYEYYIRAIIYHHQ